MLNTYIIMSVLSTVIQTAAGAIQGAANRHSQERMNATNLANQRSTNAQNRAWQSADADKIMSWNTPREQLARLKAAGMNPYIMYGNGGVSNTASNINSSQGSAYAGTAPQFQMDPRLFSDLQKNDAETKLLEKQADLTEAQAESVDNENGVFGQRWEMEQQSFEKSIRALDDNHDLSEIQKESEKIKLTRERIAANSDAMDLYFKQEYGESNQKIDLVNKCLEAQNKKQAIEKLRQELKYGTLAMQVPEAARDKFVKDFEALLDDPIGYFNNLKSQVEEVNKETTPDSSENFWSRSINKSGFPTFPQILNKLGGYYSNYMQNIYSSYRKR